MPAPCFQFVQVENQVSDDAKGLAARRLARSHAVKQALEKKRKLQRESGGNFRVTTSFDKTKRVANKKNCLGTLGGSPFSLSAGSIDPFQSLAVDSLRLQALLGDRKGRLAPEPVFTVAKELAFQSFRSVFRTGLVDPALLSAVMLSLAFTVTGGSINRECLGYQGQAIGYIRERMGSLDEATSESTIGAILLLTGIEAQLGITSQVQLHLGAVQLLLAICKSKSIHLTAGIKRAIFWQDLNSSILSGSSRIADHTTFAELQWIRDSFTPTFFRLPPGFQKRSYLLSNEFIRALEDVNALKRIREEFDCSTKSDVMLMASINNHTASIQSRLFGLSNLSPIMECCNLAAYICSVMLCCTTWCGLVIPAHVSSQLLYKLSKTNDDSAWNEHPDLLLWILYIGGAFAPMGQVRSDYVTLLRSNNATRFVGWYRSWKDLIEMLDQFIWSEKAFNLPVRSLWEEGSIGEDFLRTSYEYI